MDQTPSKSTGPGLFMMGNTEKPDASKNPKAKRAVSRTTKNTLDDIKKNEKNTNKKEEENRTYAQAGIVGTLSQRNPTGSGHEPNPDPAPSGVVVSGRSGCGSLEELFHFTFLSLAVGFLLVYLREVTIPFVIALFLMYLFRPLADSVELLFQSSHCCCSISSTTEDGTKDEERGLLSNSHHTNTNNNSKNKNNYVLEDDVLDDDDGIFEEVSVGYRLFNCSKGCAGYAGRVVGTALSVMMALLFMGGIAVVIAHSLNELEQGGKMDNYRKQYSLLENRTARYFTQNFHIDGDKFVTQVWGGSDGIGTVSVALLGFMTNFASALLLVLVFLTFMLVDDQYNEGPRSRWEKNNNQNKNNNKENVLKKKKTTDFEDTLDKEEKEEVLVEELSCVERVYWYVCCCYQDDKTDLVNLQTNEYIGIRQAINSSIMQYIVLKTKICVFASILVFFMLTILSIPLAGLIAITSFVLNYIPNFGPAVATLLPIPVVLLDADLSSAQGVLAILLPALVHGLVGNLLEPVLFKANKEIDLHPVVLIGCIVFWYILWGVPGAILAVPLTTTIKIISEKIEEGSRLRGEESNGAWAMKEILNGRIPFHDDVQE